MTKKVKKTTQASLSVAETDNTVYLSSAAWDGNFRDRLNYDRTKILSEAINSWRLNPISRRIIEITTEFVLGDGFSFSAPKEVEKHLHDFWNHRLNKLEAQLPEWADEAWRTGDLFLLLSVDPGGMAYARALPSESINVIETTGNDYRQETFYKRDALDTAPWPAYDPDQEQEVFVLHFPLNRAVGASFGESDLAPVLFWIKLYRQWLEDRAQLNYFRQMFSFVLQRPFQSSAEKEAYRHSFMAKIPKKSGGLVLLEKDESLSVINPYLASFEAEADGLALKRMIAAGVGLPLHYLAEPESSTRTTAEAAGTPTFKRFKRRQQYLVDVVQTLLQTVAAIRQKRMPGAQASVHPEDIHILAPDITERDNANLAISVQRIVTAFAPLYNARLIPPEEFVRLVYRFVAETAPEQIGGFAPVSVRAGRLPPEPVAEPEKGERNG
jgi:hypothetical protein